MKEEKLKKLYDKSIEETQGFYNGQSGNVATTSRTLVLGMIATIWVVWYRDGQINNLHWMLVVALCMCFAYLLLELILYLWNACFYHKQLDKLDDNFGKENYLDKNFNSEMQEFSGKAYIGMIVKFVFFLLTSVFFIHGMILHFFC